MFFATRKRERNKIISYTLKLKSLLSVSLVDQYIVFVLLTHLLKR